jgi:hypothetical protein
LLSEFAWLGGASVNRASPNNLEVTTESGVHLAFFGAMRIQCVAEPSRVEGNGLVVASVFDLAGTKAKAILDRSEWKDYVDLSALVRAGHALPDIIGYATTISRHCSNSQRRRSSGHSSTSRKARRWTFRPTSGASSSLPSPARPRRPSPRSSHTAPRSADDLQRREGGNEMGTRSWTSLIRRPVGAWIGAVALGALTGWAFLTQIFPLAVLLSLVSLVVALRGPRVACSGLLTGTGLAWVALTLSQTWGPLSWVWLLGGVAILAAGAVPMNPWLHVAGASDRSPAARHSKAVVGISVAAMLALAGVGLPVRPGEHALPTTTTPWWFRLMCGGVGLDAVVRGSPNDPHVAWLESRISIPGIPPGTREDVIWPEGYRARFSPNLEILDGWGIVVLRDGERVSGSCGGVADNGDLYMVPPFN